MQRHGSAGAADRQAAFAFRLAREQTGKLKATYKPEGSRAHLMGHPEFALAFGNAKRRICEMDLRFVEELDPLRQAVLEMHVAVALGTPYNDFDNHSMRPNSNVEAVQKPLSRQGVRTQILTLSPRKVACPATSCKEMTKAMRLLPLVLLFLVAPFVDVETNSRIRNASSAPLMDVTVGGIEYGNIGAGRYTFILTVKDGDIDLSGKRD